MNNKLLLLLLAFCLMSFSSIFSLSLVYNIKIRRSFDLDFPTKKKSHVLFSALPILLQQTRLIKETQLNIPIHFNEKNVIRGAIFNVRYMRRNQWWFEVSTALAKETSSLTNKSTCTFSRTGLDDIVFIGGYIKKFLGDNAELELYGIVGFPIRRKVRPFELYNTLVGTRFFSMGSGTEGSYNFVNSKTRTIFITTQVRFLHFFNRKWIPISSHSTNIQPGNETDILLAFYYREKKNNIEIGYNPTFFTHRATIVEKRKIKTENFVTHSMYAYGEHFFKKNFLIQNPFIVGVGISAGWGKKFDTRIVNGWFNITYIF